MYKIETADALVSQATMDGSVKNSARDWAPASEAYGIYTSLLHDRDVAGTVGLKDLIHFKFGEALLKTGQNERAAAEFLAAAKVEGANEGLVTMAHLYAAQSLDAGNRRSEAMVQYRLVLSRPDVYDAHLQARKALGENR